jgi:hypothetical protein
MTWTIDQKLHKLEITLTKFNTGMIWQRFILNKNIPDGEEVMDPAMVEKIHEQLAHLTTDNPISDPVKVQCNVFIFQNTIIFQKKYSVKTRSDAERH